MAHSLVAASTDQRCSNALAGDLAFCSAIHGSLRIWACSLDPSSLHRPVSHCSDSLRSRKMSVPDIVIVPNIAIIPCFCGPTDSTEQSPTNLRLLCRKGTLAVMILQAITHYTYKPLLVKSCMFFAASLTFMGTPNREPQEYSRTIIGI